MDDLKLESTEYIETIDQLNEELSTIKDRIQQVRVCCIVVIDRCIVLMNRCR